PRTGTWPEDGWISGRMQRPVVLLPLPDSPTRPNISPSSIVKLTLSTALTTDGWLNRPCLRTKCLTRFRTSRSAISVSAADLKVRRYVPPLHARPVHVPPVVEADLKVRLRRGRPRAGSACIRASDDEGCRVRSPARR